MNLSDQVCALEYAKRLKELGVKQDSYFYWYEIHNVSTLEDYKWESDVSGKKPYSAFTVAELGEMLPIGFVFSKRTDKWFYCGEGLDLEDAGFDDENEANARALMLINLIENNLLDPKTLEK